MPSLHQHQSVWTAAFYFAGVVHVRCVACHSAFFTRQTLTNFTLLPRGVRTTQNTSIETSHIFAGAFASHSQDSVLQQSQSKVCTGIFSKIKPRFSTSIFNYQLPQPQQTTNPKPHNDNAVQAFRHDLPTLIPILQISQPQLHLKEQQ